MSEEKQNKRELFNRLPGEWPSDLFPTIQERVRQANRKVIVLDDDPTGTQTVHGVSVLTEWPISALEHELLSSDPAFYLLTNSRSLPYDQAHALNTDIGERLARAMGLPAIVGAGGPMGQMHVQRALELSNGPNTIIATDVNDDRLTSLKEMFAPLAEKHGRSMLFFNPYTAEKSFNNFVMEATQGQGADDVVVSVPIAKLMEEGDSVKKSDGMMVLFAGVPNGTMRSVNLSNVYLSNGQYTGTSGLTMNDQSLVMQRRVAGTLSPGRSVAAIGGLECATEAFETVIEGKYPGKVVIFPQIHALAQMGLKELKERLPEVAARLGDDSKWTNEAEEVLIEMLWKKPGDDAEQK